MSSENLIIPSNVHIRGTLTTDAVNLPDNSVGDENVDPSAPLAPNKVQQQIIRQLAQLTTVDTSAERRVVHQARDTGTLLEVWATVTQAAVGASVATVNVLKNGVTVLSGLLTINNGHAAFSRVMGSVDPLVQDYVAEDVFEISITTSSPSGSLPRGLCVFLMFWEQPGA